MQWYDLQRHLPRFSEYQTAIDRLQRQIVWENIQSHPYIVAQYLHLRFQTFLQTVLQPHLKFTDHWWRYEWQARGSGHLHCLFWVKQAPVLGQLTDAFRATFARFWGQKITALNPHPLRLPDTRNPASLQSSLVMNTADQFAAFLNRLQQHTTCRPSYCLRTRKGASKLECRFFYPRPLIETPTVTNQIRPGSWLFAPARNQGLLNQCVPVYTMAWMANTDVQPPTDIHAVLSYIGKYVSKPEKKSILYTNL